MNVDVRDLLSGCPPHIRADIEPADARIGIENADTALSQQGVDRAQLVFAKIEIIDDVPSRNDERMQMHDGKFVAHRERQLISRNDFVCSDLAEWASFDH